MSAIIGVLVRLACGKIQWLANAVGMSLALLAMQLTSTTHPPGEQGLGYEARVSGFEGFKGIQGGIEVQGRDTYVPGSDSHPGSHSR